MRNPAYAGIVKMRKEREMLSNGILVTDEDERGIGGTGVKEIVNGLICGECANEKFGCTRRNVVEPSAGFFGVFIFSYYLHWFTIYVSQNPLCSNRGQWWTTCYAPLLALTKRLFNSANNFATPS